MVVTSFAWARGWHIHFDFCNYLLHLILKQNIYMPMPHTRKQAYSIHLHEAVGPLLKIPRSCIRIKMKDSPSNPVNTKILLQSSQAGKV